MREPFLHGLLFAPVAFIPSACVVVVSCKSCICVYKLLEFDTLIHIRLINSRFRIIGLWEAQKISACCVQRECFSVGDRFLSLGSRRPPCIERVCSRWRWPGFRRKIRTSAGLVPMVSLSSTVACLRAEHMSNDWTVLFTFCVCVCFFSFWPFYCQKIDFSHRTALFHGAHLSRGLRYGSSFRLFRG